MMDSILTQPPEDSPPPEGQRADLFEGAADPGHESFTRALHSSFNVLRFIMVGLVVLYMFSGCFKVQPGQQGLVARLGKLRGAQGPAIFAQGLHFVWPDPFDEKIRLSGQQHKLVVDSFLFEPRDRKRPLSEWEPQTSLLRPGRDGSLLTGDRNLSHARWTIEYQLRKPNTATGTLGGAVDFVNNVGDGIESAELLLQRLTENAVVRTVASRRIEDVLRGKGAEIAGAVKDHMQSELNRLDCGITITKIIPVTLEPRAVRGLTEFITQAANSKRKVEEEARKKETEILNQAAGAEHKKLLELIAQYETEQSSGADDARLAEMRDGIDAELSRAGGAVANVLQAAQSIRTENFEHMQRDYEEFKSHLANYRRDPVGTKLGMWTDMRFRIHASDQNTSFFLPDTASDITINRDPKAAIERDMESYRSKLAEPRP